MKQNKRMPFNTKKQRLAIYKKALKHEHIENGLCFVFFYLVTGQKHGRYCDWNYDSEVETPSHMHLHLPEFSNYYKYFNKIKYLRLYDSNKMKWRQKVIENCIKLCEE